MEIWACDQKEFLIETLKIVQFLNSRNFKFKLYFVKQNDKKQPKFWSRKSIYIINKPWDMYTLQIPALHHHRIHSHRTTNCRRKKKLA